MSQRERAVELGGEEDFGPYIDPDAHPYHAQPHHAARSAVHQPNHLGFLKRLLQTKARGYEIFWNRRRLMRRIRRS